MRRDLHQPKTKNGWKQQQHQPEDPHQFVDRVHAPRHLKLAYINRTHPTISHLHRREEQAVLQVRARKLELVISILHYVQINYNGKGLFWCCTHYPLKMHRFP